MPCDRIQIKCVHRLTIFFHDIVRNVFQIVDRADTIMGGENSKITENVKTVLFEAATFNGANIRKSAKRLGLRTDASGIFEKGLDPRNAQAAIDRACQLIQELGCGEVTDGMVEVCAPLQDIFCNFGIFSAHDAGNADFFLCVTDHQHIAVQIAHPKVEVKATTEKAEDYISVEVEDSVLCPRYCARVCTNIKIAPSPQWMQRRLAASGIRPINNLVDITNYWK